AGGSNGLIGTAGQNALGTSSGGSFSLSSGFWGGGVGGACPTITVSPVSPSLPPGTAGTLYSQSFTQTGGTGTITWSISSSAAPANMTLNSATGVLSGAPTGFGTFNFTVRATGADSCFGERAYSLLIN